MKDENPFPPDTLAYAKWEMRREWDAFKAELRKAFSFSVASWWAKIKREFGK